MLTRFIATTTCSVFFLLSISDVFAQADVKVSSIPVTSQITMLAAKGGNVGVFIGDDGTFVIDDQFAPLSEKLMAAITTLGGDSPRFLLNTHFHGDHTGGNENFGEMGALIVSHNNARERLVEGTEIKAFGMKTPPAADKALPVVTYMNEMFFYLNKDTVRIVHTPNAHTDGDSFVHFEKANVVHAGDIFFNGFYPFIDAEHGGSLKGTIAAVDAILAVTDASSKIIPGHGPLADKAQLEAYRRMLETAYTNLLTLKNDGLTTGEAKLRKPLEALDAKWSGGIFTSDRWIEIVYSAVAE